MFRIAACLTEQHDFRLVLLAAVVCLFGCYTALSLLRRTQNTGAVSWRWLAAASVVAGASVWATHFVAMLAYQPGIVVGYDIALTGLSIAIAIAAIFVAFTVATQFKSPMAGGALFGLAVGAMHFTGMRALSVPAEFHWSASYVAAALALGVVFGALALRLFARGGGRLGATLTMTLAIAGLHFTAMTALTLAPDPTVAIPAGTLLAPHWLPIVVAMVMAMIIALGLSGSAVDQHLAERAIAEATRLRTYVGELEATKAELQSTSENLSKALEGAFAASQAKSQFLATMSHELRTPLNAIIGFSEMISMEIYGPLGDHRYRDYIKDVRDSGKHLLNLVNDVLDFSKVDAGHLELVDDLIELGDIARETVRMVGGQALVARVHLSVEIPTNLPLLRADERRVRQVLINLLSNAIKFTPNGGAVIISAFEAGDRLALQVSDNGIGIAADDIPLALERFGQVDSSLSRKHEGTGLGLPLSKRLMELHGGTLEIVSTLRVGTKVTVTFPASRKVAKQAAA